MVHTQTTVDRVIDRLWLRVQLRAAQHGITLTEVARRMGIKRVTLYGKCSLPQISRPFFERLVEALATDADGNVSTDPWWDTPLPATPRIITTEKMLEKVRAKLG